MVVRFSSRFALLARSTAQEKIATVPTAITIRTAATGRVRKMVKSPEDRLSDCFSRTSSIGPSTSPTTSGKTGIALRIRNRPITANASVNSASVS